MNAISLRSIYRVNVRLVTVACLATALAAAGWVASRLASGKPPPPEADLALEGAVPARNRQAKAHDLKLAERNPFASVRLDEILAAEAAARASAEETAREKAAARKAEQARAKAEKEARARAKAEAEARAKKEQADRVKAAAMAAMAASPAKKEPAALAKKAHPPPPPVMMTYCGMLTRTDGTTLAIFNTSREGETLLLEAGDAVEGYIVKRLAPDGAVLTQPDGEADDVVLGVGKQTELPPITQGTE
jgi:FKBP-type peptidyl-prolyl cis-trans isomerase